MAYGFISSLYGGVEIGTCDIITSTRLITYGRVGGNLMGNADFAAAVADIRTRDVYEMGANDSFPNLCWRFNTMNRGGTTVLYGYFDGYTQYGSSYRQVMSGVPVFVSGQTTGTSWAHVGVYNATIRTNPGSTPRNALVILWSYDMPVEGAYITTSWTVSVSSATSLDSWLLAYPTSFGVIPEDPYAPGGISEPGGGDGDFDFSSTDIPIPALPTTGAYDTGFLTLYAPSANGLKALAQYMWSGTFDPTALRRLVAEPMDVIMGLSIIPTITGHPATTPATLMVGNISTGVFMEQLTEQYYELDCGTVTIPPKWGAYLDYAPYSKLSLYLPYIGYVNISPDDCMRGEIKVVYHVDMLSGTCTAYVYCKSNRGTDGHTLYTYNGSVACPCPVTSGQYGSLITGALNIAGAAAGIATGNPMSIATGLGSIAKTAIDAVKPEVQRSGQTGGTAGLMGIQYPYLILTVPRLCTPADQDKLVGYPSYVTVDISDCTGYTEIEVSHLEGMSCTENEALEIIGLLKEGVVF